MKMSILELVYKIKLQIGTPRAYKHRSYTKTWLSSKGKRRDINEREEKYFNQAF